MIQSRALTQLDELFARFDADSAACPACQLSDRMYEKFGRPPCKCAPVEQSK